MSKLRNALSKILLFSIFTLTMTQILHAQTANQDLILSPIWSPDGQHIAYMGNNGITVIDSDGDNAQLISPPTGFGGWTADSTGVLIIENRFPAVAAQEWWVYPLDGSASFQIFPQFAIINDLAYSSDGSQVVLSAQETTSESNMIWVGDSDGTNLIAVAEYPSFDVSWSADDEYIIVATRLLNGERLEDALVYIDGANVANQQIDFLPSDSIQLAETISLQFDPQASFAPASYYVTDLMVNDEVSLSINQLVGSVIYSTDSETIAYTTYCDSEAVSSSFLSGEWSMDEQWQVETALYVVDITTMALREVIPCGVGSQFSISFSPDGKQILLIWVDTAWELYRIELDTLTRVNLTA